MAFEGRRDPKLDFKGYLIQFIVLFMGEVSKK